MHPAHPFAVAFGQIVVHRDDVHPLAGQGVEVGRQHAGQGLALAGLHFRDVAQVQRGAAHQLHIERALGQHPPCRFATHRERLGQQIVERDRALRVGEPRPELVGLGPQLGIGQRLDVVGQGVDVVGHPTQPFDHAAFTKAQQLGQHS